MREEIRPSNERIHGCVSGWMDWWINGWMDGWMGGRADDWKDGSLKGLMDLCKNGNVYTCKDSTISKHKCLYFVLFIIRLTTCVGPCAGPSSGHKINKEENYTGW